MTINEFDLAASSGEVYHPDQITRDIALIRLREAKELFELAILSKEDFEKEKLKYGQYFL